MRLLPRKFNADELKIFSNFLIDVAKGILGVPLIAYFLKDFSPIAIGAVFMVDFIIVILLLATAIYLHRVAKERNL